MLNLVCQAANSQGFIDLGAGWTLVDDKDFVENSSEPSERESYASWHPYCMDGARPGYIPRGDMPGIYHTSLPDGWEYVVNPYYDPFSKYKSCALPYVFRRISTGHVQLRYPVCPDFEKVIYGVV